MPDAKTVTKTHRIASLDIESVQTSSEIRACYACGKGVQKPRPVVSVCLSSLYIDESSIEWVCLMCLQRTFRYDATVLQATYAVYNRAKNRKHYAQFFRFVDLYPYTLHHTDIRRVHDIDEAGQAIPPQYMSKAMTALWYYDSNVDVRENFQWLVATMHPTHTHYRRLHMGIPRWPSHEIIRAVKLLRQG